MYAREMVLNSRRRHLLYPVRVSRKEQKRLERAGIQEIRQKWQFGAGISCERDSQLCSFFAAGRQQ
jgi:hypothetical protein